MHDNGDDFDEIFTALADGIADLFEGSGNTKTTMIILLVIAAILLIGFLIFV